MSDHARPNGRRPSSIIYAVWMGLLAIVLAACGGAPAATVATPLPIAEAESPAELPSPTIVAPAAEPATPTAEPPTPEATPTPEAPSLAPSPTVEPAPPTTIPTATPDPYAELTIDALAARDYGGGLIEITDTLETNERFTRYEIAYPSDGLTIYGFMNVPNEGSSFPVAIVLHGYIPPAEYEIVDYTRRYADALAEAGYFVINPNLRNYPPSDSGPDPYRIGYATDVLNLIAIIREQSQDPLGTLRRANEDQIHLWGHSMGGGVALRVAAVLGGEPYLRAALLYGSMSGDEEKNYGRIRGWTSNQRGRFELQASPEMIHAISPIHHLERITAAIAVHHSYADDVVPAAWSEELCALLDELSAAGAIPHPPECFFYDLQPHTFRGDGDLIFMERTAEFFDRK